MTFVTAPGLAGLEIDVVCGESAVVSAWASNPLKLLIPRSRGPSVWAYLTSFGGGLVAGDETALKIRLGAGATSYVTTQASTKIYRNPGLLPCGHRLTANLGDASTLVMVPEPILPFAGSTYIQRQEFHLSGGAGLILVDWICSGRAARGERWAFQRFQSINELFVDGERIVIDSLVLDPADGPLEHPHRMGRFNCLAVVIVIGPSLAGRAARILEDVSAQPVERRAPLVVSASPLRDGVLLRIIGERVEDVSREIHQRLDFISEILGDEPWTRKW